MHYLFMCVQLPGDMDGSSGYDLAYVRLTEERLGELILRHRRWAVQHQEDDQLSSLVYHDGSCWWVEANHDDFLEKLPVASDILEQVGWFSLPHSFVFPEFEEKRTELDRVHFNGTHVYWTAIAKHADFVVTTEHVPITEIERLYDACLRRKLSKTDAPQANDPGDQAPVRRSRSRPRRRK